MTAPLEGVRVLDLSRVLAGPWCSMTLGDMGADVIKIESLDGDDTRSWGPPFIEASGHTLSAYFACVNRNKRSLAVNMREERGQKLVQKLALKADILLENFKTGGAEKLGVGYDQLHTQNPELIYCSISGYGRTGSKAHTPGYDFIIQAEAGLMSITGPMDGKPYKVGMAVTDITTGMNATSAILAALFARTRTGRGQRLDISLYDTQVQWLGNVASTTLFNGKEARRWGNNHANIVPYQLFEAAENTWLVITVGNDGQWRHLCDILKKPDWKTDERFATNPARVNNRDVICPLIGDVLLTRRAEDWLPEMEAVGIPCGRVRGVKEALDDPLTIERGLRISLPQEQMGVEIPMVGSALHFSETPVSYRSAPPLTGQHTLDILQKELGLTQADIDALTRDHIIKNS